MHPYKEQPGDFLSKKFYPNRTLYSYTALREGRPANGWGSKKYYPDGGLQQEENYSDGLLIEKISYNESGIITEHKIWNNRLKQLINKPPHSKLSKPNVVTGHASITNFLRQLPVVAEFINADYNKDSFLQSYDIFRDSELEEAEWRMAGNQMSFTVYWNYEEVTYQWHCHCASEELYWKARKFLEDKF